MEDRRSLWPLLIFVAVAIASTQRRQTEQNRARGLSKTGGAWLTTYPVSDESDEFPRELERSTHRDSDKRPKEQFENDLRLEMSGVKHYNHAVELCTRLQDNGTREILEPILAESEEHVDWLETQLGLIEAVGLQNYLTEQMGEAEA